MTSETEQQQFTPTPPQEEHRWLQRLVGEWTYEGEMSMAPDQPTEKSSGRESVRSLGDLWIVAEAEDVMPGGGSQRTMITLGYDPQKGQFVGTFISSVMGKMWLYEGELSGYTLTLNSEGPAMDGSDRIAQYQDIIELESDDHRVFRSQALDDDGNWQQFMLTHYRRVR